MAIVSAEVRFAPQLTAWFTANPTKVLQDGEIVYCSDGANIGKYVIGDNSAQLSTLTFYGGVSSSGLTIGTTTITGGTNTRILYNNAGVVGEYLVTGTGTTAVLSDSPTFTTSIITPKIDGVSSLIALTTNTIHTTTGSFCAGRSNPDRPIEVYSSTGSATMQAYTTSSTSIAGVYSQANNAAAYIGLIQSSNSWTTNGLRQADSSWIDSAGVILGIWNANPVGDVVFATGGFAAANEKLRFSPTVTTFKTNTINLDNGTASRILATDASKNVQFLDTATYPSLTELSYVKGVTSSIQTQISKQIFTTSHFHGSPQTVGTTTLFFNAYPTGNGIAGSSGGVGVTIVPFDCTLVGFSLSVLVFGTLGTANNATVYVRVNNTTDITLSSSVLYSASTSQYSSSALNTNLSAGDYIEIKIVPNCTPTAATSVAENVTLYFKAR